MTTAAPHAAASGGAELPLDDDLQNLVQGVVGGDHRAPAVSQLPLVDALADGLSAADSQQLVRQCLSIAALDPTDSATFGASVRSEMDAERLEELLTTSGVTVEQPRRGAQPAQMRTARLRFSAALCTKSAGSEAAEPAGAAESASAAAGGLSGLAAEIIHGLNPNRKATSLEDEAAAERLVKLSMNPDAVAALKELGRLVKSDSDQATIASKAIDAQRLYPEIAALLHHEGLKIPETGALCLGIEESGSVRVGLAELQELAKIAMHCQKVVPTAVATRRLSSQTLRRCCRCRRSCSCSRRCGSVGWCAKTTIQSSS
jgi:hypothetical protein